ncbi:MAG: hypothetical protein U5L05_10840 [Rubrivivax sp.]|nr:hypothetical protein [Rubrivivax sp.]
MQDTVVLASLVAARQAKPGQPNFALTIDCVEKAYAAGRIPHGRDRREGMATEREVLDALVDLAPPPGHVRRCSVWCNPASAPSPASSSRSRPTWTRRTATASPSCACAQAASSAA